MILRYGVADGPERSFREIGRHLGVSDHTARKLAARAPAGPRRLITRRIRPGQPRRPRPL